MTNTKQRLRAAVRRIQERCARVGAILAGMLARRDRQAAPAVDEVEHQEAEMWTGPPGECGAACSCGIAYDGFDSVAEASDLLASQHIAHHEAVSTP